MLKRIKISAAEVKWLIITAVIPSSILFLPNLTVQLASQDAWLSIVFSGLFAGLVLAILLGLGRRLPEKHLLDWFQEAFGKVIGYAVAGIYLLWFGLRAGSFLREVGYHIETSILVGTPKLAIAIVIILASGYAVHQGLEVIVRSNRFIGLFFVTNLILMLLAINVNFEWMNFFPLLEFGILPAVKGGLVEGISFGELVFLGLLYPCISNKKQTVQVRRSVYWMTFLMLASFIGGIGIMGAEQMKKLEMPIYMVARYFKIGDLSRLDPFITMLWFMGAFFKVTIFYFFTAATAEWLFKQSKGLLIFLTGLFIFGVSVFPEANIFILLDYYIDYWFPFSFLVEFVIPLCALALVYVKGVGKAR